MIRNGVPAASLIGADWRKSSRSGAVGNCVELAPLDGGTAVRDSKCPTGPALVFPGSVAEVIRGFTR
ncbi:DUF397 domain-containing protein [Actinokineospora fastidiosa]|uniref:DUF397 domain-containing protein n=1 Tax=Actinokineospora fastidiosa TaxID=1816 RepID=A0A918GPJ4_9PSEU|nr:DUF397 domain-containing protein [Actinokineospora fastidiosa]UVS81281.1 hypothetical protein Actkin_05038 [Actinokineospora sp. UTMC 2448]GGS52633.1 hypothetical protein GCM10010171_54630 [Actinokineospora fastidiosa]